MLIPDSPVLVLNSGSSSLKFAVYPADEQRWLSGKLTRIGLDNGRLETTDRQHRIQSIQCDLPDHSAALTFLFNWLQEQPTIRLCAVGHRLVHGGITYRTPQRVTPELLADLRLLIPLAPDHLPAEISLIEAVSQLYPELPQVVCFDTAFHQTMPDLAKRLPIPRQLADEGLIRYGFHGLSYEYVLSQLAREAGPEAAQGRILLAHLGNGASMTAVRQGKSLDTTMGFTPTGGLMMGTRSGDLDPGVLLYLLTNKQMEASALSHLLNDESGLRGVSGLSSDMQELLQQAPHNQAAAQAIDLFCYQARKQMGAMLTVLNGLDTLVFTGGMGEQAPAIRTQICAQLDYLGIVLDPDRNAASAAVISPEGHLPVVRIIPTNEEIMIARHTRQFLALGQAQSNTFSADPGQNTNTVNR
ncbi:acetate/propionate family kinase [Spirosoma radiotolerans]|uniref:acetate/propionate family kinase n=1 Tax=Spirosoma radiotolerans TaxID=1379870 RepID=UPI0006270D5D|nr:acetate/propionate family kinase [Spirosoma radiotolerans]